MPNLDEPKHITRPSLREIWMLFSRTTWRAGFEHWAGKPKFRIGFDWYDWWHFIIHIGKFWMCCSHMFEEQEMYAQGFKFTFAVCPVCLKCVGNLKKENDPDRKKNDVIFHSAEKSSCPYCGYEVVPDFWVSQDYDMIMAVFGSKGLTDSIDREQWHKDQHKKQQEKK